MQSIDFIRRALTEWYQKHTVKAPPQIERREFGAGVDKKIDFRHLKFRDEQSLNMYIRTSSPLYISYSAAYYEFPDGRPMEKKNWLGADLVFDLDADEYETPCTHPNDLVCEICMDRVKQEAIKLIEEYLIPDFGFNKNDLYIVFSGNRGYHIHIRNEEVHPLSQNGRKEVVDYLTANGLEPQYLGLVEMGKRIYGPKLDSKGWAGKIVSEIYSILSSDDKKFIAKQLGIPSKTAERIINEKDFILEGIKHGEWYRAGIPKKTWEKAFKIIAMKKAAGIDKNVTIDVSRLMRVPTSIHGSTGLQAAEIKNIDTFDVFKDPVVLPDDPVTVVGIKNIDFVLADQTFEIKNNLKIELPKYAAVYACGKDMAKVIE
ncbi:MAG: DNA primase catalytic subunit PriS [Candidatus Diapherotrites archaeon]|nr:DNA primase catalytic subunit PriS [Candidatus Diapherotrites archaeon]